MPELPEVETIRIGLERLLLGRRLKSINILCEKSFRGRASDLIGAEVVDVKRRGKALLMKWSNGKWLMIHLRMTGQIIFVDSRERFAAGHPDESFCEEMPGRQTRVIFLFDDDSNLYFNDQRKFGFCSVMTLSQLKADKFLNKLAPEPWDMSSEEFCARLRRHQNTSVKAAILDQAIVAGLGNIYADESLYAAEIWPGERVADLDDGELRRLQREAIRVMRLAIDAGGSTMRDYVRADGTRGDYLDKFAQVFRRNGEKCKKCGAIIEKTKIAGRGTHYCPKCQCPKLRK